ncbi:helix-turn-helix transcriptional regulator [Xenorhabdus eapokensis]|uniref:HTH-type transcriptional activator RhaR n=1 Tax=Xenorhabdus eapokensis TaxID=1873482 RepID=A0A1Q5TP90_9GAMM|nr:helix-turn-helix transcriptional regulator [Xenorhabdus eapokensis]OKP02022.1 HTH-type transcriptional activator RhaR [Xenorhabdus eapokensis]
MAINAVVAEDHLSLLSENISTSAHRHAFLHLIISRTHQPITINIEENSIISKAILINSKVMHTIFLVQQPYWLILINHTSSLAYCLRHQYLPEKKPFSCFSDFISEALSLNAAKLQNVKLDVSHYNTVWKKLLVILAINHCYLTHDINDQRIQQVLTKISSTNELPAQQDSLLKTIYLSKSRLSHLFTDITGSSLKSYLLFQRLMRALWLIAQGNRITDAALQSGFDSPSHLSATCRKLMGIKPSFAKHVSQFLKVPEE